MPLLGKLYDVVVVNFGKQITVKHRRTLPGVSHCQFRSLYPQLHSKHKAQLCKCSVDIIPAFVLRNMASNLSQSTFLTRKASPNILVQFLGLEMTTADEAFLLEKMNTAIVSLYGRDRFVLYRVKEDELAFNSKVYSASALLLVTKDEPTCELPSQMNIPVLHLDWNLLRPKETGQFDFDYFSRQIQNHCMDDGEKNDDSPLKHNPCDQVFLFDYDGLYEKWSEIARPKGLHLIEYSKLRGLENLSSSDVLYISSKNENLNEAPVDFPFFNARQYFANLQAKHLGRSLLFADQFTSTMDLADRFKNVHGIVAITNCQTAGIGRNNNKWLSPLGCAMFTVNLQLSMHSGIFGHLSLLQHIVSLSVVLALPSQLNIKIKWPNDVLYVDSMSKLAGILVRSFLHGNTVNVQIGLGLNLSNRHPSVCLSDILDYYNSQLAPGTPQLEPISRETLIARILNQLECLLALLEQGKIEDIKQLYCANWIHSKLDIELEDKGCRKRTATICGIDDSGYLLAVDSVTGEQMSLTPDGNRFDLMHRLVTLNA